MASRGVFLALMAAATLALAYTQRGDPNQAASGSPTLAPLPTPTLELLATPAPEAVVAPTRERGRSFALHFIDVGEGDATLLTSGRERLLVDGGISKTRIRARLRSVGLMDLDAGLATRADADHMARLIEVLDLHAVEGIYYHEEDESTRTYADFVDAEGAVVSDTRRGDRFRLGDVELRVIHPGPTLSGESNDDSVVLHLVCGSVDVLHAGDATTVSEAEMLNAGVVEDVEVLKVGHHGSRTGTSDAWLDATRPEWAVISAGLDNPYGHPHPEVTERTLAQAI